MKFMAQDNVLSGKTLAEKFQCAKDLGLDGIEVTWFDRQQESPLEAKKAELTGLIEQTGIYPRVLCGAYRHHIGDWKKENREIAINQLLNNFSACADLGVLGMICPATCGVSRDGFTGSVEDERDILLESLKRLAEKAEKYKVYIILEPLNRYEDRIICRLEQAAQMVDRVCSPYIRLMADFFHMSIEELDINASLSKYSSYLRHVHLADSTRIQPGTARTDFASGLKALDAVGYEYYASLECGIAEENRFGLLQECFEFLKAGL